MTSPLAFCAVPGGIAAPPASAAEFSRPRKMPCEPAPLVVISPLHVLQIVLF
jgi:hypothetical protein